MNKLFIYISVLILGRKTNIESKDIFINKSIKIFPNEFNNNSKDYIFKWQHPIGPDNKQVLFNLKNNIMIFTPTKIGEYNVSLLIEDLNKNIVSKKQFIFNSIEDTIKSAILKNNFNNDNVIPEINKQQHKIKKEAKNDIHSIPIVWSRELMEIDNEIKLISMPNHIVLIEDNFISPIPKEFLLSII